MDFVEAYEQHREQIGRHARTVFVPGLESEDVASEMTVCLWNACKNYTPGKGQFAPYWWSLWLNRKADIIRSWNAEKRVHPIPVETLPETGYGEALFPMPPAESDHLGCKVWLDIAVGYSPTEVRRKHHLSARRYYSLIESWRTDEVRRSLLSR